jgi:LPXTG-motif cell wall-anchored protein
MARRTQLGILTLTLAVALFVTSGTTGAQEVEPDPYVAPATSIAPETTVLNPENPAAAAAAVGGAQAEAGAQTEVQGASLAFTGGDVFALALIGAVLVGAGILLVRSRRNSGAVHTG